MSIEPEFTTLFRSGGAVCYSRFDLSGARSVREVEKTGHHKDSFMLKDLIEFIAQSLVDHPEQVKVREIEEEKVNGRRVERRRRRFGKGNWKGRAYRESP